MQWLNFGAQIFVIFRARRWHYDSTISFYDINFNQQHIGALALCNCTSSGRCFFGSCKPEMGTKCRTRHPGPDKSNVSPKFLKHSIGKQFQRWLLVTTLIMSKGVIKITSIFWPLEFWIWKFISRRHCHWPNRPIDLDTVNVA